jgi:hypothetical protein
VCSNDNPIFAHIASSHDDLAFGADTKRNERSYVPLRCAAVQRSGLSELSAAAVDAQIHGSQQLAGDLRVLVHRVPRYCFTP